MGSEFDDILGADYGTDDAVTAERLAQLLGVSSRIVRSHAQEGIIPKSGPNAHPLTASINAYCAHLREKAAGRSGSKTLTEERVRVAREQADKLAMQNEAARGELIPARDVEAAWSTVLRDVRAAMLTIPTRVAQRLGHLTPRDLHEIDAEIRRALEEAGNDI